MNDFDGVQLLFDNILIEPDKPKESTEGGIFTGDAKVTDTGIVLLVGKGKQAEDTGIWIDIQLSVGDHVWFDRHGAVQYMDTEYIILEQGYCKSKI